MKETIGVMASKATRKNIRIGVLVTLIWAIGLVLGFQIGYSVAPRVETTELVQPPMLIQRVPGGDMIRI